MHLHFILIGSQIISYSSFARPRLLGDDCGYLAVLTCIHNLCLGQNYEKSQTISTENCYFYSREISLFIARECLRYVIIDIYKCNTFNE